MIPWPSDEELDEDQFYNRQYTVDLLYNMLNSSQYGSTPSILLIGVRGIGKTVLMKKLQKMFQKDFLVIYINLRNVDAYQEKNLDRLSIMKLFYKSIIQSAKEKGLNIKTKQLEKYFRTNNFKIDKILSYEHFPIPIITSQTDYPNFADFVINLPQKIYEENNDKIKGVFMFIDEFQVLKELDNNLNSFLWFLRNNIQSQKNVAYMISGSMSLNDRFIGKLNGRKGAFGGRMMTIEVEPFSFETTCNYIEEKVPELNFTDEALRRFYRCSQGIPSIINTMLKVLPANKTLDKQYIKEVYIKSLPILANEEIEEWYTLTKGEQLIITSLIEKPLKRFELADKLKVTSGSLSNQLNKLENLLFIEINNEKQYQTCDSVFKLWLKKHYEKYGVYPYRHSLNITTE